MPTSPELHANPILVIVENEKTGEVPTISPASAKLVRLARELTTGPVWAMSVDPVADVSGAGAAGADKVAVPNAPDYNPVVPAAVTDVALATLSEIDNCAAVLLSSTYLGRAVTAMLGIHTTAGAAVDVTSLRVEESRFLAEKSALGGSWITAFEVTQGAPILALRPGVGPAEGPAGEAAVVEVTTTLSGPAKSVHVVESVKETRGDRVPIAEADVVVVGGRGVAGDFTLVEALADALGGAVGSTRVACDEGWVSRATQIGQTGLSIAPEIYLGLGVSGAVHHTCGMLGSETIVAIVDDPDAPILELADFAVVGDVEEVVPQALAHLNSQS